MGGQAMPRRMPVEPTRISKAQKAGMQGEIGECRMSGSQLLRRRKRKVNIHLNHHRSHAQK